MINNKVFGEYLKAKREDAKLSQKDAAEKLSVGESLVADWENGVCYPSLEYIGDICALYKVSERELLSAGSDKKAVAAAQRSKRNKTAAKGLRVAQFIVYGVALLTCFICNLAIQGTLSWFFIVLASVLVAASLTLLPLLVENRRGLITLGGFTLALMLLLLVCSLYTGGRWFVIAAVPTLFGLAVVSLPFVFWSLTLPGKWNDHKALLCMAIDTVLLFVLLLVCSLYTGGGWFFTTACPIALYSLILPWALLLIIRYTKLNKALKTAASLAVFAVYYYFLHGVVDRILGLPYDFALRFNFSDWSLGMINGNINAIVLFATLGLAVIFAAVGFVRAARGRVKA